VAVASTAAVTGNGESTRIRVIEAALTCIAEKGYYRASSNEIARTAGVTWGVIAHHFGSREALMLAALERAGERLHDTVVESDISGVTLEERLGKYLEVLTKHYGQPTYLAYLQILNNLSRDPQTSERTAVVIARNNEMLQADVLSLQSAVLGRVSRGSNVSGFLFHSCRGLALSHLVLRSGGVSGAADLPVTKAEQAHADMLVQALATELRALGIRD
jgi:AcrR family transcriptional regulator